MALDGYGRITSLLVSRRGEVIHEQYPGTEYGYLWWLRSFAGHPSYYMSGSGGNRVHVVPDLELVAVITTTNFDIAAAHDIMDRLLVNEVLDRYG